MNKFETIAGFLEEYAGFFETILQTEKDKLQILLKGTLKEIEKTITIQQANEKKIQNMEKKRMDLQKSLGMEGWTLKQIIDTFDGEEKEKLLVLFERIDRTLHDIKFYNKKGMDVASANIHLFGQQNNAEGIYSKESIIKK